MPDAWEVLISKSAAPAGSDAWTHLNAQGGLSLVEMMDAMFDADDIEVEIADGPTVTIDSAIEVEIDTGAIEVEVCE